MPKDEHRAALACFVKQNHFKKLQIFELYSQPKQPLSFVYNRNCVRLQETFKTKELLITSIN